MRLAGGLETHRFTAFGGATCELIAWNSGPEELSQAIADVYAFEARLSRFDPASELSAFNAAAGTGWVPTTPLLGAVLDAALGAHARSAGLVNAASLRAVIAAGYDIGIEAVRRRGTGAAVAGEPVAVPPLPDVLEVDGGRARLAAGCGIDLGGVGKGWLADRLAERLADAVVNLGGDLRAVGRGPGGEGWPVALCDGRTVVVADAGVATSGTAGRRWPGGHHLVDPRTGRPASTDVAAVTVVAADATDAECLAKAAAVLGSTAGPAFATERGALAVAVIRDEGAGEAPS